MNSPGYTPIYRILKDGMDITSNFNDRAVSIDVEFANMDFGDQLRISLDDRGSEIAFPEVGAELSVYLGYREVGLAPMGSFRVEEVILSGPPRSVTINASSNGLATELAAPAIDAFEDQSISDIVGKLAEGAGLAASIHPVFAGLTIPFMNQTQSASALLGEIARNFGGVVKIVDGRVIVAPRDAGESVGGVVMPIFVLGPEHFGTWEVRHNSRTSYSHVEVSWFDPVDNVRKWVSEPTGIKPDAAGLIRSIANAIAGETAEARSVPFKLGSMFASEAEAKAAAKAKGKSLVRGSAGLSCQLAAGDPWIRDQQRLAVRGMRTGVDGDWIVSRAVHSFSDAGLVTRLEATVNGLGAAYDEAAEQFLIPGPGEVVGKLLVGRNGMVAGGV